LLSDRVRVLAPETAFCPSKLRESRDMKGNLTHVNGDERIELIKGLQVYNVETNSLEPL
jgi:hypothetical protein